MRDRQDAHGAFRNPRALRWQIVRRSGDGAAKHCREVVPGGPDYHPRSACLLGGRVANTWRVEYSKRSKRGPLPEGPNCTRRASDDADRASPEQELGIGQGALEENMPRSFVLGRWPGQSKTIVLLEALLLAGAIGPTRRGRSESRDGNDHPRRRRTCTRQ